jgi:CheY-like chemotaxis protein
VAPRARTILIVEDDVECLEAVKDALEGDGYVVVTATQGLQGLQRLESGPLPDLILLDLMMPVMDGWQFLREQRRRPALAALPVALLSGERDLAHRAGDLKVAGYIRKPFDLDELLAVVTGILGDRSASD